MVLRGSECHLGRLNGSIDELAKLAYEQDTEAIKEKLQKAVPEYTPQMNGHGMKAKQTEEVDQTDSVDESRPTTSPTHLMSA
jgi:hypothetical protein